MTRLLLTGLGTLMAIAGAVFTLQGLGFLHGSSMTGVTAWAILGPIIAVAGLALIGVGRRAERD
jgi:drug/metabolite transporter superfamily protein YnfA